MHTRAHIQIIDQGKMAVLQQDGEYLLALCAGDGLFEIKQAMA